MSVDNRTTAKFASTSTAARPRPGMNGTASEELNTPLPRWWLWTVLSHRRLVDRLLDRLSGLAAGASYTNGVLGWHARTAVARNSPRCRRNARADDGQARGRARCSRSRRRRNCSTSPARRSAGAPLPTIARRATAPAAAAPRAIRTSTTTTGCGAARSPTSSRPSPTARAPATTRANKVSSCRRSAATAC